MSLDQNLFTLHFTPHTDNANVIDLVDPSGTIHYRKQRILCPEYKIEIYGAYLYLVENHVLTMQYPDPMSESLLASATAPSPVSKLKTLELYNPTSVVELKYTGTLSFRWSFKWEEYVSGQYFNGLQPYCFNNQSWFRVEARRMFYDSQTRPTSDCGRNERNTGTVENSICSDLRLQPQSVSTL